MWPLTVLPPGLTLAYTGAVTSELVPSGDLGREMEAASARPILAVGARVNLVGKVVVRWGRFSGDIVRLMTGPDVERR